MKKFLLLLTLTCSMVYAFAQNNTGQNNFSSISISTNSAITLQILSNGAVLNEMPASNVEARYLRPGNRVLDIRIFNGYITETLRETIFLEANTTVFYVLESNGYNGYRLRKVNGMNGNGGNGGGGWNGGNGGGGWNGGNGGGCNGCNGSCNNDNRSERLLINADNLIRTIKRMSFDDQKLKVAKSAIRRGFIRSGDVKRIMSEFSFENKKLEFAKFAYKYCYDPQNYYEVAEGFSFPASADELLDFIDK
jgi:Domain of unknown function (DUF4476)